jgi:hypothetical protein
MAPPAGFDLELYTTLAGRALRAPLFYVVALLGLGGTFALRPYIKPVYRSEAVLSYRDRPAHLLSTTDGISARRVALQLGEMLFARERLQSLITEFNLYPQLVAKRGLPSAVEEMGARRLRLDNREGYSYRLSFEAEDPRLARVVTARAAEMLMAAHARLRREEAVKAKTFLDGEERTAREELRARELDLVRFLAANPAMAVNATAMPVTADAQLRAAQQDEGGSDGRPTLGLEVQAAELKARLGERERAPVAGRAGEGAAGTADPGLLAARAAADAEVDAAQRALVEVQARYTENHPDVRNASAGVVLARERARRAAEAVSRSEREGRPVSGQTSSAPSSSGAEAASLRRQLALVEQQIKIVRDYGRPHRRGRKLDSQQLARLGAQYADLDRKVREARGRQETLETKRFQASLQATLEVQESDGELVLVDPAFEPFQPARSGRMKVTLLGVALSLALAALLALARVAMSDRLHGGIDLQRFALPLLLVEVPRSRQRKKPLGP